MMTIEEKIQMYKRKNAFIESLNEAFQTRPSGSTVESVVYEVFKKDVTFEDRIVTYFQEWLVVNFFGGGRSVRSANGNSNIANFRALGSLVEGGYYDEVRTYEDMEANGFTKVDLDNNDKLDKLLSKPMTHIGDVRACFNYCRDCRDVERVIKMIPAVFGSFTVDYDTGDDETFLITNDYEEAGDNCSDYAEYEFWTEEN